MGVAFRRRRVNHRNQAVSSASAESAPAQESSPSRTPSRSSSGGSRTTRCPPTGSAWPRCRRPLRGGPPSVVNALVLEPTTEASKSLGTSAGQRLVAVASQRRRADAAVSGPHQLRFAQERPQLRLSHRECGGQSWDSYPRSDLSSRRPTLPSPLLYWPVSLSRLRSSDCRLRPRTEVCLMTLDSRGSGGTAGGCSSEL